MTITLSDYLLLSPEIFVLSMACMILVVEAFFGERYRQISYLLSQLTLLVAALLSGSLIDNEPAVLLDGRIVFSRLEVFYSRNKTELALHAAFPDGTGDMGLRGFLTKERSHQAHRRAAGEEGDGDRLLRARRRADPDRRHAALRLGSHDGAGHRHDLAVDALIEDIYTTAGVPLPKE